MDSREELVAFIIKRIEQLAKDKGQEPPALDSASNLLNGTLDSLDLAALVVELQERTKRDPFAHGIVVFNSVAELADLYAC